MLSCIFYPDVCTLRNTQFNVVVQMGPFLIHRNICMVFPFCLMLGVMLLVMPDGKGRWKSCSCARDALRGSV